MPQKQTTELDRKQRGILNQSYLLRQQVLLALFERRFGADEASFRRAIAKHLQKGWKDAGLARSAKRWLKGAPPIMVRRRSVRAICLTFGIQEAADLFELPMKELARPPFYAFADELSCKYGELRASAPSAGLPPLGLMDFDYILSYGNWRSALVRSTLGVASVRDSSDLRYTAHENGVWLTQRGDAFASHLYRLLSMLLEDAEKQNPNEGHGGALAVLLVQLGEVLRQPASAPDVRADAKTAITDTVREMQKISLAESKGLLKAARARVKGGSGLRDVRKGR